MSARIVAVVLLLAAAVAGVSWLASRAVAAPPAMHTVYCAHGDGPPVGFVAVGGLGAGCPPGFHSVAG